MKKKVLIASLVLICIIALSVFAHSGNTDSKGGHYNHSTGEYHYHTGEYAGRGSSSSMPWYLPYGILLLIGAIYFTCTLISESLPNHVISNLENALCNYKNAKYHTDFCNKELIEIKKKAIIPDGYAIGKDGLPKEVNCSNFKDEFDCLPISITSTNIASTKNWGKSLTVYTVMDGWKLHLDKKCCGSLYTSKNVYSFYNKRYSICKKCAENYKMPNMDWYAAYLKIEQNEKFYELAKSKEKNDLTKLHNCYNDCNTRTAKFFMFFSSSKKKMNDLKSQYNQIIRNI